jgi:hypothetical protein
MVATELEYATYHCPHVDLKALSGGDPVMLDGTAVTRDATGAFTSKAHVVRTAGMAGSTPQAHDARPRTMGLFAAAGRRRSRSAEVDAEPLVQAIAAADSAVSALGVRWHRYCGQVNAAPRTNTVASHVTVSTVVVSSRSVRVPKVS